MNTGTTKEGKQIVSLQELVPQHDCLKLLILHTPYTLLIDTLPLCTNLVKLDLSKNNLETFPHLGTLSALRFMFLHQNRLDLNQLKNIFELDGQPSQLSENIVWVTFWGNKSPFLARHYLANSTKAIAVDKYMIAPEERSPNFPYFEAPEAFSPQTSIESFFRRKPNTTKHASEEQYMSELWQQLKELRQKHESLFPVIKIQKVFRGWILRETFKRKNEKLEEIYLVQDRFFVEWKQYTERKIKLKRILAEKGKDYLVYEGREARRKEIIYKMLDWAKRAKKRVAARNSTLVNQYRFYKAFKNNYDELNNLYSLLQLERSSCLFISKNSWNLFTSVIIPFASNFTKTKIVGIQNQEYGLHYLYEYFTDITKETLKIYQTNLKSIVFHLKTRLRVDPKTLRRGRKKLNFQIDLKSTYRPLHCSNSKKRDIEQRIRYLQTKDEFSKEDLIKVEGDLRLLKDMVRGIYFYNTKRINSHREDEERIHFLSERSIKKISSAITIQKHWRGFIFRKKNDHYLRAILRIQRAATIIQRWFRRLPSLRRKDFMLKTSKKMPQIQDNLLYIDSNSYINLVSQPIRQETPVFLEQNTKILINRQTKVLSLSWDTKNDDILIEDNVKFKNIPFSQSFFLKTIGLTSDQLKQKVTFTYDGCQEADPSYIFHFETQTSLVRKQGKKYLEIQCSSKQQARFRYLLLKLVTISLVNKEGISVLSSFDLPNSQTITKIDPVFQQVSFICNQNDELFQTCQKALKRNPKITLTVVANRYYFQKNDQKPIKAEENFFVFTKNPQEKEKPQHQYKQQNSEKFAKRYRTEISAIEEVNSRFLTDLRENSQSQIHVSLPQDKFRKVVAKRSMKQFKVDKRLKQRRPQQPSFILDSISINDRLTTQPEAYATQPSGRQPHLNEKIISSKGNLSHHKTENVEVNKNYSQDRRHPKSIYSEKRAQSLKRQEDDGFIRKFVNMGNFIQNQFANDHRRRQKIQSQHSVIESAENIKRSMERSHSQRVAKMQQKLKDVREKHSQHLQLVNKKEQSNKEHMDRLKNQITEEKEKRIKEKSRLKRLKVSFAEECYPLGNRNRSSEHFT